MKISTKFQGAHASKNTATHQTSNAVLRDGFFMDNRMLKRLFLSLGLCLGLTAQALAYGTIPGISMAQQLGTTGAPLIGGLVYLIQAGTTSTPQNCYQDTALTIAWPNPITLDSTGRVPQLFCADGSIKVRITDSTGVQQFVGDNILVVGASGGGGGGSSVDATTILATGDVKITYGTGVLSGFVRANGRTIGSATSGATERANADTQALFLYLWGADANLTVSTGRGVSAAADWAANKTITLPDARGRSLAGLDDMGNSAAGRLTATYFGTAATVLGAAGGDEKQTLTQLQLPAFKPAITITDPGHQHSFTTNSGLQTVNGTGGATAWSGGTSANTSTATTGITAALTSNLGSGNAHPVASPMILATVYLKL